MIEIEIETVLTLNDAAKLLPRRRRGKKPHVATLYRWASHGLRGVRLEVLRIGGTTCTSREALQRFFDRLTAAGTTAKQQVPASNPEAIEEVLINAGF